MTNKGVKYECPFCTRATYSKILGKKMLRVCKWCGTQFMCFTELADPVGEDALGELLPWSKQFPHDTSEDKGRE